MNNLWIDVVLCLLMRRRSAQNLSPATMTAKEVFNRRRK